MIAPMPIAPPAQTTRARHRSPRGNSLRLTMVLGCALWLTDAALAATAAPQPAAATPQPAPPARAPRQLGQYSGFEGREAELGRVVASALRGVTPNGAPGAAQSTRATTSRAARRCSGWR